MHPEKKNELKKSPNKFFGHSDHYGMKNRDNF